MKVRVFTLPLGEDGHFDDESLQAFLHDRQALAVSEHFFTHQGRPTLALVVQYREPSSREVAAGRAAPAPVRRDDRGDLTLAPEEKGPFEGLRRWRNERARKDGKPAYVLFTNGQLLELVRARPQNFEELLRLEGIGEARVRDYGEEVLAVLKALPPSALVVPKDGSGGPSGSEPPDRAG